MKHWSGLSDVPIRCPARTLNQRSGLYSTPKISQREVLQAFATSWRLRRQSLMNISSPGVANVRRISRHTSHGRNECRNDAHGHPGLVDLHRAHMRLLSSPPGLRKLSDTGCDSHSQTGVVGMGRMDDRNAVCISQIWYKQPRS